MKSEVIAAWVQAIGSIGAIIFAIALTSWQHYKAQQFAVSERRRAVLNMLRSIHDEVAIIETFFIG